MAYRKCSKCKGLNGQFKNIYPSINDVLSAIRYIQSENPSVRLNYYKCPHGNGYHLTEKV
ncbi:MAG: hypothetical protein IKQ61_01870 [Spirochaetales bacterium]|nr:hypothetical protein [Spirochaetales bacterium]